MTCFCGQPDDRERVHRAHECLPWVTTEGAYRMVPSDYIDPCDYCGHENSEHAEDGCRACPCDVPQ